MSFHNRNYMILSTSETGSVDFNEVLETSSQTLRLSVDESLTFVKWEGDIPSSVDSLSSKQGPYTHSEILSILSTETWTDTSSSMV
jgi:hypothetical protein